MPARRLLFLTNHSGRKPSIIELGARIKAELFVAVLGASNGQLLGRHPHDILVIQTQAILLADGDLLRMYARPESDHSLCE